MAYTEWEICRATIGGEQMHMILCDDDPDFSRTLCREVERVMEKLNIRTEVDCYHSFSEIPQAAFSDCSVVFFDIDFEDEEYTGIDLARKLREANKHALIFFVTNFIEYAPAGYEVQAFRYILKRDMSEVLERYLMQAVEQLAQEQEYLHLRDREDTVELALEKIGFFEVMDHSVSVHAGEEVYMLSTTLSSLEQQLEKRGFLRIHKSYLVNMRCIRKFRSRECHLDSGVVLAVSEKNYAQQKQKYLLWKGLN